MPEGMKVPRRKINHDPAHHAAQPFNGAYRKHTTPQSQRAFIALALDRLKLEQQRKAMRDLKKKQQREAELRQEQDHKQRGFNEARQAFEQTLLNASLAATKEME